MLKIIQFLQNNEEVLELLKHNKISLVGVDSSEQKAILEAFAEKNSAPDNGIWA